MIFARDNGSRKLGRVWDFSKLLVYPTTRYFVLAILVIKGKKQYYPKRFVEVM